MPGILALDGFCVDFPEPGEAVAAGGEQIFGVVGESKIPHPEFLGRAFQLSIQLEVGIALVDSNRAVAAASPKEERIGREADFQASAGLTRELHPGAGFCQLIAARHQVPNVDEAFVINSGKQFPIRADVDVNKSVGCFRYKLLVVVAFDVPQVDRAGASTNSQFHLIRMQNDGVDGREAVEHSFAHRIGRI